MVEWNIWELQTKGALRVTRVDIDELTVLRLRASPRGLSRYGLLYLSDLTECSFKGTSTILRS